MLQCRTDKNYSQGVGSRPPSGGGGSRSYTLSCQQHTLPAWLAIMKRTTLEGRSEFGLNSFFFLFFLQITAIATEKHVDSNDVGLFFSLYCTEQ